MNLSDIGRCWSCVVDPCPTPKVKKLHPERGCPKWSDGDRANLAHVFVESLGRDLLEVKEEYDGMCIDFAGDMIDWLGYGRLVYFETPLHPNWRYHAAAEIDGIIHDLWEDEPLELTAYMKKIGATGVDYPAGHGCPKWDSGEMELPRD